MDLPPADYLPDIEIIDEYESDSRTVRGLSEQQVLEIARDSLEAAVQERRAMNDRSAPDAEPV